MKVVQVGLASLLVVSLTAALPGLYHYTESGPQPQKSAEVSPNSREKAIDRLNLKTVKEVPKPPVPSPSELPKTPFKLDKITTDEEQTIQHTLRVNINSAKAEQLQRIPGIGPATAQDIIKYRKKHTIDSASDLDKIDGIGPATVDKMKEHILVQGNIPD
jgi:competence ComEA-like helix-hairpin-helix protein